MRSSSFSKPSCDIAFNHNFRVESMNQIAWFHCLFLDPSVHSPKSITKQLSWLDRSNRRGLIRSSSECPMISAELPMNSAELPMISAERLDSGQGETLFSLIIMLNSDSSLKLLAMNSLSSSSNVSMRL